MLSGLPEHQMKPEEAMPPGPVPADHDSVSRADLIPIPRYIQLRFGGDVCEFDLPR
jgi:hypothetical protein